MRYILALISLYFLSLPTLALASKPLELHCNKILLKIGKDKIDGWVCKAEFRDKHGNWQSFICTVDKDFDINGSCQGGGLWHVDNRKSSHDDDDDY